MVFQLTQVQADAIRPDQSVWLTAHAGTGKTRVLIDRILRLLVQGEAPSGILAITFTNAAAAEMQLRLRDAAKAWAQMSDAELGAVLKCLGCAATADELERARGLFLTLLEASPPLQILTVHGFCQRLLSRYPVEAGLSTPPNVIDDGQRFELLNQARARLFEVLAGSKDDSQLSKAVRHIMQSLGDESVRSVVDAIISKSHALFPAWMSEHGQTRYISALADALPDCALDDAALLALKPLDDAQLREAIAVLEQGSTKGDAELLRQIAHWLEHRDLHDYAGAYLTKDGEPRKALLSKKLCDNHPDVEDALRQEQGWAHRVNQARLNREIYALSEYCVHLGTALMAAYRELKDIAGAMDYDDLIHQTHGLLSQAGRCEWVLSKLDFQLQHILLDEAQDTSPAQWSLLSLLIEELFVPELYHDSPRTLFVVGDRKQSIYKFQGADPQGFGRYAQHYQEWFASTGQGFAALTLDRSFRSSAAVLQLVDAICALPVIKESLQEDAVAHAVHRADAYGLVQAWPLIQAEKTELLPPWEVTEPRASEPDAKAQLATLIAADIRARLDAGTVHAGGIMILVQRRSDFIATLSAALLRENIPLAGADRLQLHQHLAVKDVLALAAWCMQSADDLSLASILKGPLFNWSETQLFDAAHGREGSLWARLTGPEADVLSEIKSLSATLRPYEWLCAVLERFGMAHRLRAQMGDEVDDILRELKEQFLLFESQSLPNLQLFLQWFENAQSDLKRDMEQGANAVRIMTVHGAKGLQAPLVYLPDTVRVPKPRDSVIWHEGAAGAPPLALVSPQGSKGSAAIATLKQANRAQELAEYDRLLYVALTRAENELVVCGYETGNKASDDCWYRKLEGAFGALGVEADAQGYYALSSGDRMPETAQIEPDSPLMLPDWLAALPPASKHQPRVYAPSELIAYEAQGEAGGRERGTQLHHLLQLLPASQVSAQMLLAFEPDAALIAEALEIHQQHPWLFAPESRAEVSLQGHVLWRGNPIFVRGQVDRLVVEADRIVIVDYKSNRDVPTAIPQAYLAQLAAYRALLAPIYPQKPIAAAILWTAQAKLDWADDAALQQLCLPCAAQLDSPAA